jgi:hypothetical protein
VVTGAIPVLVMSRVATPNLGITPSSSGVSGRKLSLSLRASSGSKPNAIFEAVLFETDDRTALGN